MGSTSGYFLNYQKTIVNFLMSHINGDKILSVGCGKGSVESLIRGNTNIGIQGLEVAKYPKSKIPVKIYKGNKFPFKDKSFDTTMFIHVLHHTESNESIEKIMAEAIRVSRKNILILDHVYTDFLDKLPLSIYDLFANKLVNFNIDVTFNYLKEKEWFGLFKKLNLDVKVTEHPFKNPIFKVIFFKLEV